MKCHNYYNYHLSEIILSLSLSLNQTPSGHMNIQLSVNELVFIKNRCFTCMINVSSIFTWVENKMLPGLYMCSVLHFYCYYSDCKGRLKFKHLAFLSLLPVSDSGVKHRITYVRSHVVIPKSHPETHFCPSGISD